MSNLAYLLVAVALSVLGSLILWLRHRRPRSLESGIDEFSRELRALAPKHHAGSDGGGEGAAHG
ncbi:MAG: hypothetical protein QOK43_2767 [Acidimicrobiaceae bacterium]|jgi:hypothetical protein|nr:hypothetical protein [Acidimicrobiaceae bacterium]MDQ1443936.1 hypothetical protein [Acidimicrobiaceae bacterium]